MAASVLALGAAEMAVRHVPRLFPAAAAIGIDASPLTDASVT